MKLQFRTAKELRRFGWGCVGWTLGGSMLPLMIALLSPHGTPLDTGTCLLTGVLALCLYAAGTWVSQSIARGSTDAPRMRDMQSATVLLYVFSVVLGPALLVRLGLELWGRRREKNAAPWEKADDTE